MKYFICVLGMVFVIEGLPYFTYPDRIKSYLSKLTELPEAKLRILGAVAVSLGLVLVYFGTT
jgi:uncharacterized protein YjeT (DUF2065 family)